MKYKGRCIQKAPQGSEHYTYYIRGSDAKKVDKSYVDLSAIGSAALVGFCGRHVEGVPIWTHDRFGKLYVVDAESLP